MAAFERVIATPEDHGQPWDSLVLTPDVEAMNGGTAYIPSPGGVMQGSLPAPYDAPAAHADRLTGGDRVERFTVTLRLQS